MEREAFSRAFARLKASPSNVKGTCVLRAFGLTDKDRVRPVNEDCFAIQEELGLCVIADGMGGHNAGEVAAQLAVDAVVDVIARNIVSVALARGSRDNCTAVVARYDDDQRRTR